MSKRNQGFIPCTMARGIGDGIFFRPVKSWHSATYAGEKLTKIPGSYDGSGCMWTERFHGLQVCCVPYTVTHRLYWHERDPSKTVSAFLSYPNAMGCSDEYFWETSGIGDDVERHFGDDAEADMEKFIAAHFAQQPVTS